MLSCTSLNTLNTHVLMITQSCSSLYQGEPGPPGNTGEKGFPGSPVRQCYCSQSCFRGGWYYISPFIHEMLEYNVESRGYSHRTPFPSSGHITKSALDRHLRPLWCISLFYFLAIQVQRSSAFKNAAQRIGTNASSYLWMQEYLLGLVYQLVLRCASVDRIVSGRGRHVPVYTCSFNLSLSSTFKYFCTDFFEGRGYGWVNECVFSDLLIQWTKSACVQMTENIRRASDFLCAQPSVC